MGFIKVKASSRARAHVRRVRKAYKRGSLIVASRRLNEAMYTAATNQYAVNTYWRRDQLARTADRLQLKLEGASNLLKIKKDRGAMLSLRRRLRRFVK